MYIKIRAFPDFHSDKIEKLADDKFKVYVKAPAKNGQANKAICELVANYFGNPEGGVKIVSGHIGPSKLLQVGK